MGLLDSVLGGGPPERSGISAATKALLVVLAAKAAKDYMSHRQQAPQGGAAPAGAGMGGGGLGGILGSVLGGGQAGGLGSILGGGQAGGLGSILGGGGGLGGGGLGSLLSGLGGAGVLGSLVEQFNRNGHGDTMGSWIGTGPNQPMAPAQLAEALGPEPLQELEGQTGLPRQTLLEQLSRELPAAVDHVTPQGRLPTDQELTDTVQPN